MTSWQLPTGNMIIRERNCVTCRRTVLIFGKTGFVFASLRPVHIAHRSVWRIPEAYKVWTVDRYTDPVIRVSLSPWRVCKERAATFMLSLHLVLIVQPSVAPSEATDKEGWRNERQSEKGKKMYTGKGERLNAPLTTLKILLSANLSYPYCSRSELTPYNPYVLVGNLPLPSSIFIGIYPRTPSVLGAWGSVVVKALRC